MGKAAAPGAAKAASSRKRANESGQQSIEAAFQAKRHHTTANAGKPATSPPEAVTDTTQHSDQLLNTNGSIPEQQQAPACDKDGAAEAIPNSSSDSPPGAAATGTDETAPEPQQQAHAAADPPESTKPLGDEQAKQVSPAKPKARSKAAAGAAAKSSTKQTAGAAAKKPRASSSKAAKNSSNAAAAAAAAASDDGAGSDYEGDDADAAASEEDAGAGEDAAAVDVAAAAAAADAKFEEDEVAKIQEALLSWYDTVHRVLPWRRNPHSKLQQQQQQQPDPAAAPAAGSSGAAAEGRADGKGAKVQQPKKVKKPTKKELAAAEAEAVLAAAVPAPAGLSPQAFAYYVWVSEVMLQQTQVARVVAYFNKWISTWPTVSALASASQSEVNEAWAGLGYYRRAKYLLDGAQFIVNKLGGKFPETAAELRKIPGVGPYTAAAVGSIAFGDAAAAVDGNVIRVVSRLRAVRGNPTKSHMVKVWDRLAGQLLHPHRPGCHNQAMMELGATVCKPANPACHTCPISTWCSAVRQVAEYAAAGGCPDLEDAPRVTDYPEKVAKAAKREEQVAVCLLKVLLLPDATTPEAVAAAAAAAAAAAKSSGKGSKAAAGKGTSAAAGAQGNIRSFFKPQPNPNKPSLEGDRPGHSQKNNINNTSGDATQQAQQQQQQLEQGQEQHLLCEADLVSAGAAVHYLLVQRPETGLLAGLWEFPGVIIDFEPTPTARRSAVDGFLAGSLGVVFPGSSSSSNGSSRRQTAAAAAGVHVVQRRQLGSSVHIFSHIRQTSHAEELVVLAPSLGAVCPAAAAAAGAGTNAAKTSTGSGKAGSSRASSAEEAGDETAAARGPDGRPTLRWVAGTDMLQQGLTSGVRKLLNLSLK